MPRDALEPLRQALLKVAREDAARLLAGADQMARDIEAEARRESERIRDQARAKGAADAAGMAAAQRSVAGREARALVLAAHRTEYDALRSAARDAVTRLSTEPEYPVARERMADLLRRLLGDGAHVADAAGGGVTATVRGRSADLTLARLADRAVDAVLAEESP